MSWSWNGNTSGLVTSTPQNLPMVVDNFLIVNKAAGATVFNIYKITAESTEICMSPLNKSLGTGEIYESERPFVMLATEQVKVQVSGNIDYDFTISNTQAPEVGT